MRCSQQVVLFSVLALAVLLWACAPAGDDGIPDSEEEAFLDDVSGEGAALAGQAVQVGCNTQRVISCAENADGSVTAEYANRRGSATRVRIVDGRKVVEPVTSPNIVRTLSNRCLTRPGAVVELAFQIDCASASELRYCRYRCDSNEDCSEGMCVAPEAPEVELPPAANMNIEGVSDVQVTSEETSEGIIVRVEAAGEPVMEVMAEPGADLSEVEVERSGSTVVARGVESEHVLYVPNTRNNGVFVCPSAQQVSEVNSGCAGLMAYTHEQCLDAGVPDCFVSGSQYGVRVEGSGATEAAAEENFCYYLHADGSRYPSGTLSHQTQNDYGGTETEEGIIASECRAENSGISWLHGTRCGVNDLYGSEDFVSGEGVEPEEVTYYVQSCGTLPCNAAGDRCCNSVSQTHSCEGDVYRNTTITDCSAEPIVREESRPDWGDFFCSEGIETDYGVFGAGWQESRWSCSRQFIVCRRDPPALAYYISGFDSCSPGYSRVAGPLTWPGCP